MRTLTLLAGGLVVIGLAACSAAPSGWGKTDNSSPGGDDAGTTAPPSSTDDDSGTTPPTSNDAGTPATKDAGTSNGKDSGVVQDAGDGFDQFQHHNLDVINKYRAGKGVAPLVLDAKLCTFALAGSKELTQDHTPHQHFIDAGNNGTLWTSGFTTSAGENQGDPNGWTKLSNDPTTNELDQIDSIQLAMYNEGPGQGEAHGHYMNMMNTKFKRVGVGLVEVSGHLYLTNDFSD